MEDDSSDGRVSQTLKHAAGMVAAAGAYRGLQFARKQATGKEAPMGPDDQQAPLGRAIAWTLVMGAAITTARMIAIRYTAKLLHSRQQSMTETAAAALADNPGQLRVRSLRSQVPDPCPGPARHREVRLRRDRRLAVVSASPLVPGSLLARMIPGI